MSDAAAIYREASTLAPSDQLRLVEMLLADLARPDERIERLWGAEAQKRWDAYRRGESQALSY